MDETQLVVTVTPSLKKMTLTIILLFYDQDQIPHSHPVGVGSEGSLSDEQESSQRGVFALRIPARRYSTAGRSCQEYSSRSGEK